MVGRSRARYLAPIALVAVIACTYLVIHTGLNPKHATTSDAPSTLFTPQRRRRATARFYVVRPGDNLTAISHKTGVSVGTIEALNPNIDPNSLQAAQRLRLRR